METLDGHGERCEYALLPCPKGCREQSGEIPRVLRKDLGEHLEKVCPLRAHQCQHCGERGTYSEMTQVHAVECEKKPVCCPWCGEAML